MLCHAVPLFDNAARVCVGQQWTTHVDMIYVAFVEPALETDGRWIEGLDMANSRDLFNLELP